MVSFDLADGYYTLGINEANRDNFMVNYRGTLYRLADGKAQYMYLAIPAARLYQRELHSVLGSREGWGKNVKMTYQLRLDLRW
eukprot:jgi/Tetstr1/457031/TSEL_043695.t1